MLDVNKSWRVIFEVLCWDQTIQSRRLEQKFDLLWLGHKSVYRQKYLIQFDTFTTTLVTHRGPDSSPMYNKTVEEFCGHCQVEQ